MLLSTYIHTEIINVSFSLSPMLSLLPLFSKPRLPVPHKLRATNTSMAISLQQFLLL